MKDIEEIARTIVHSSIKIHRALGPGLLESVYQKCLTYELEKSGLKATCEVPLPVKYEEANIDIGFRIDMLVEDKIIVENKTVYRLMAIYPVK